MGVRSVLRDGSLCRIDVIAHELRDLPRGHDPSALGGVSKLGIGSRSQGRMGARADQTCTVTSSSHQMHVLVFLGCKSHPFRFALPAILAQWVIMQYPTDAGCYLCGSSRLLTGRIRCWLVSRFQRGITL